MLGLKMDQDFQSYALLYAMKHCFQEVVRQGVGIAKVEVAHAVPLTPLRTQHYGAEKKNRWQVDMIVNDGGGVSGFTLKARVVGVDF